VTSSSLIPPERIERRILLIRGQKVMLDADLAELYEIETREVNQAVRRNIERFPSDFMFELLAEESKALSADSALRSQFVISNKGPGGRRHPPLVFTEQGVAMLSSVLKSRRAVLVNIAIMRAFVKIRETLALHKELSAKIDDLCRRVAGHDAQIQTVFDAITELTEGGETAPRKIGFTPEARSRPNPG